MKWFAVFLMLISPACFSSVSVSPMNLSIDKGKATVTVKNKSKTESYRISTELVYQEGNDYETQKSFLVYPPAINNLKPGETRIIKLKRLPVKKFKPGTELKVRVHKGDGYNGFSLGVKCDAC